MTPYELSILTRKLRVLKVRVNTLKTIRNDLPLTPKGLDIPEAYVIMVKSMEAVIKDWENQMVVLENKFLTL